MGLAHDRRQMMLAGRDEGNVPQQHRFLIALGVGEDPLEERLGVNRIACEPFAIGAGDARRSIAQPFAIGIVAGRPDQGANGMLDGRFRQMSHVGRIVGLHVAR